MSTDNPNTGRVNTQLEALIRALLSDRPIAYHAMVAKAVGSSTAGLLLSQFLYWTPRTEDPDGWFYKTQADIVEETALTRWEQETARIRLKGLGVIEEKRRGVPGKIHFRVNFPRLQELLVSHNVGIPHSTMRKNHIVESEAAAAHNAGKPQSDKPAIYNVGNPQSITETTTEITLTPSNKSDSLVPNPKGLIPSKFRKGQRQERAEEWGSGEHAKGLPSPSKRRNAVSVSAVADTATNRGMAHIRDVLAKASIEPRPAPDGDHTQVDPRGREQLAGRPRRSANTPAVSESEAAGIRAYLGDYAPELGDKAPFKSSMTRVLNTYLASGMTVAAFTARMDSARKRTKATPKLRNKFSYFLALLEEECGLREPPPAHAQAARRTTTPTAAAPAPAPISGERKSLAGQYADRVRH